MTVFADPDLDRPLRSYEAQAEQRENTRPDEYDPEHEPTFDEQLDKRYREAVRVADEAHVALLAITIGVLR